MRYSFRNLARQALNGHRGWPRAWRDAEPAGGYDVVIIGGGRTCRIITILRSNDMVGGNTDFHEWSLNLG